MLHILRHWGIVQMLQPRADWNASCAMTASREQVPRRAASPGDPTILARAVTLRGCTRASASLRSARVAVDAIEARNCSHWGT
jgi:hypothetical protein